jgi:hypothetical protein
MTGERRDGGGRGLVRSLWHRAGVRRHSCRLTLLPGNTKNVVRG